MRLGCERPRQRHTRSTTSATAIVNNENAMTNMANCGKDQAATAAGAMAA